MLKELHISNFILIDSLEIQFPTGLVIITGQTGAGKSIILGALSLIMGAKADVGMIGECGDSCVIEALFEVGNNQTIKSLIEEYDLDWDNGYLTIRRVLNKNGRSRSFVNDSPASMDFLKELSYNLLDIHSQEQTQLLTDKRFQLSILDYFSNNQDLFYNYTLLWNELQKLKDELEKIDNILERAAKENDYNSALYEQLNNAKLIDGELEDLEIEQKKLSNAEEIKYNLLKISNVFSPVSEAHPGLERALKDSVKILEKLSQYIPTQELATRLESCRLEIIDILSEIYDIHADIDVSSEELEKIDSRISLIYDLFKRHKCSNIKELIAIRDELSKGFEINLDLEVRKKELERQIDLKNLKLASMAEQLTENRKKGALKFSRDMVNSLNFLELEYAVFEVKIEDKPISSNGKDDILFLFSSTGKNPVDVARCASGGEKSRIMLCLKSLMAHYIQMPSMIFDEIDTGVSGSVADKMGTMICEMGKKMQVFAITHLPQVAAKGNAHFLVTKEIIANGSTAKTSIKEIKDNDRILEVARLLSGSSITREAIANAKSLLKN